MPFKHTKSGKPNLFGNGTPKPKGKEKGKDIDKTDPTVPESTNMMGQMIENEQALSFGAQTRENIKKGNV